jgi:glycosyltransferase involved in cell wall biosynthesis
MSKQILIVDRIPHTRMNGVARYMTELIACFATQASELDVRILCQGRAFRPAHWLAAHRPPQPVHRLFTQVDARWLRPFAQRCAGSDLVHYPYHNLPDNWQIGRQKLVVTVHGAAAVEEPVWGVDTGRAETIRQRLAAAGDRLIHIITVSAWAGQEIARQFDLDPAWITPIHHGIDHRLFYPKPTDEAATEKIPYILHVGPCSPRKNVATLVDAVALLRHRYKQPHRLILVGRDDGDRRAMLARCAKLWIADAVQAIGVVDDARLADLYRGAACFVFPSLYEGFGLPVIEAMACGTPVITAAVTALPEVAGDAAHLLHNPQDADALATALCRMIEDRAWRQQWITRGLARAQHFTWQASAQQHLQLYGRLL